MTSNSERIGWREALTHLRDWRVLRIGLLGFSSGLPLLLVFGTLSFWLREAGIERSTIGYISWVALAYAFKVLWSPLVDRMPLPLLTRVLGRRRAWLLATQSLIAAGLLGMALSDPASRLESVVWLALLVAVASATQDVAVDAYRIESAGTRLQGILTAFYTTGYRIAMFVASAGALWIAARFDPDEASYQQGPWFHAYGIMALLMGVGILTTLFSPEPGRTVTPEPLSGSRLERLAAWLRSAVWEPFAEFFRRHGGKAALVLALIAGYRLSDIVLGAIANVFYKDMGFSKDEIALVSKGFGIYVTILGGFLGGLAVYRFGVMVVLFVGAVLAAGTNLLFAWLALRGHDFWGLVAVVGMDNLAAGVAISAFVAYLSGLVNIRFSATQYALFSSVMLLLPKFLGGFSGALVDALGYPAFFTLTALAGVPVLLLVAAAWRWTEVRSDDD